MQGRRNPLAEDVTIPHERFSSLRQAHVRWLVSLAARIPSRPCIPLLTAPQLSGIFILDSTESWSGRMERDSVLKHASNLYKVESQRRGCNPSF